MEWVFWPSELETVIRNAPFAVTIEEDDRLYAACP
jgi:hypothetical protein